MMDEGDVAPKRQLRYDQYPDGKVKFVNGEPCGDEGIRFYENGYVESIEYGTVHPPSNVMFVKPHGMEPDDG